MEIFVAPFASNAFMANVLLAGVLVSIACGIVGTFGDALGHGVLPGPSPCARRGAACAAGAGRLHGAVPSLGLHASLPRHRRRSNGALRLAQPARAPYARRRKRGSRSHRADGGERPCDQAAKYLVWRAAAARFIAKAISRRAELILLDEPASNIGASAREMYRGYIRAAAKTGVASIIATHDIEEAAACDQTLMLEHRVVAYGKGEEMLTAEALLSTFGIVGHYKEGRIVVIERKHGHDRD